MEREAGLGDLEQEPERVWKPRVATSSGGGPRKPLKSGVRLCVCVPPLNISEMGLSLC